MYKKRTKIIASILIFILTITHLNVIGQVFATSIENQSTKTNNENVEFDSYFKNGDKKEYSAIKNIGEENYLNISIKVKNAGYLKNTMVTTENANFEIAENLNNKQITKLEKNKIYFNQIKNGNTVEIALPIQMIHEDKISIEQFYKQNKIKLTATYVDGNGKEKQIEKDITVALAWTKEKTAELNVQIAKFIPYNINENKGIVLQTLVQSYLKDNVLPVKENKIEIDVPTINGIKPQEVKVTANTTKATNGDETGVSFTQGNYQYDSKTNKLTITVKNELDENKKISWKKEAKDEFIVTYIYPETEIAKEGLNVAITAKNELKIYEASETKATKSIEGQTNLKEQISSLVDFSINTNIENLSKGQIYANYEAQNKIETDYNQIITANITLPNLTDKIILEQNIDNFINEKNTKQQAMQTYYKSILVDKNEFNKILGENGEVKIYLGTTEVAKMNKDTKTNEQGKMLVDLSTLNINNLKIETSKPQTEGKINFIILKAIKGDTNYSKEQMASFNKLELNTIGKAVNKEINFVEQNLTKAITLTEPTSQAEIVIDNSNLSTVVTNQNVKITAILKTDTLDSKLYKNPTLKITLPNCIENINIKNIETLFTTEASKLTVKSHQIIQNADGTKTIVINLEGTQTEYTLGAVSKGINIVITSDITVNKFTSNKQEKIKLEYTNNNITERNVETKEVSHPVNIVAPVGVITTSTISNYAENAQSITSISGEEKTATIPILSNEKNATVSMEVINNYNNTIDNISILGRTAFKGNKDILSEKDLGTTINMPLSSNITVNGVDTSKVAIYYSENGSATKDLSLSTNGWTKTPANLENVKSYLIVLTDHTMNTADRISFNYTMKIPANLQHNESAYENYVVYFNNNLETGKVADKQASTKIGLTTGKGPVLEANLSSNIKENEEILTGKFIKYTITVKNAGTEIAKNVVANMEIPTNLMYVEEDKESSLGYKYAEIPNNKLSIQLGNIGINETVSKEITFKVEKISVTDFCKDKTHYKDENLESGIHKEEINHNENEYKTTINMEADITTTSINKTIKTNAVKNNIAKSYFSTYATSSASNDENLKENGNYKYYLNIKSENKEKNRENTIVTIKLPNELSYESILLTKYNEETRKEEDKTSEALVNFDTKTRNLTINIGTVDGIYGKVLEVNTKINEFPKDVYEKEIKVNATIKADNTREETINTVTEKLNKLGIKVTQTSTIPNGQRINAREDFSYIIEVENLSNINIREINLTDYMPKELSYKELKITYSDGTTKNSTKVDDDGNPILKFNLSGKEKIKIEIKVVSNAINQETKITNVVKFTEAELGTIEANSISHIIEKYEGVIVEDDKTTKRIMGQVWKDKNNDGIKDDEEERISNVEIMLFNNTTGNLVVNKEGNIIKVATKEDGTYELTNIPKGKYTVIFLYDTANYSATLYKKENIDETKNSDALDSKITIDGNTRIAAITEEIVIADTNIYNIDLGLISNPKFDLKLDKTIASISVQDSKGTKKYEYDNAKIAKKELVEKNIKDTTIIVEYKIKITNEGAISGFVKKIADYVPTEMKFNSELNKDWYMSENGTLYNSSLANTIINPGETKEVTLLLTKKMTENNLGLYHNEAEIYEVYNDLGMEDTDSKPANKISTEDDISSADIVISVKTGKAVIFIGLVITIITSIGLGAYYIKKKVLR